MGRNKKPNPALSSSFKWSSVGPRSHITIDGSKVTMKATWTEIRPASSRNGLKKALTFSFLDGMKNQRMKERLENGEAIDVSSCERNKEGDYILDVFEKEKDYCDAKTEEWIWSIGQDPKGKVFASTFNKFYQNPNFTCIWLR